MNWFADAGWLDTARCVFGTLLCTREILIVFQELHVGASRNINSDWCSFREILKHSAMGVSAPVLLICSSLKQITKFGYLIVIVVHLRAV
jgi:hypothetical protein